MLLLPIRRRQCLYTPPCTFRQDGTPIGPPSLQTPSRRSFLFLFSITLSLTSFVVVLSCLHGWLGPRKLNPHYLPKPDKDTVIPMGNGMLHTVERRRIAEEEEEKEKRLQSGTVFSSSVTVTLMSFCFLPSPRFHVVSFPASKCSPSVHPKLLTGTGSIRTISRIPTARDGGGDGMGDIWVTRPNDRALLGHTSNVVCGPSNPLILCFPLFFFFSFFLLIPIPCFCFFLPSTFLDGGIRQTPAKD